MKKKKKGMMAQAMAWLALFAIVIGIVGTGILVIFSSGQESGYSHGGGYEDAVQNLTQEDLQRIIDQSSVTVEAQEVDATSSGAAQ